VTKTCDRPIAFAERDFSAFVKRLPPGTLARTTSELVGYRPWMSAPRPTRWLGRPNGEQPVMALIVASDEKGVVAMFFGEHGGLWWVDDYECGFMVPVPVPKKVSRRRTGQDR
jgi:hypothetical protein